MAPSKEKETAAEEPANRKKRLSRREQKARKKQKQLKHQDQEEQSTSQNCHSSQRGATGSTEERESKSQKGRSSKKNTNNNNNSIDAWEVAPVQEEIPYIPTPLPDLESTNKTNTTKNKNKTLGKWFPKARVVKSQASATDQCTILLFYQYKTPVLWNERKVAQLMQYLQAVAQARPALGGRLRVAPEGINATISCGDAKQQDGKIVQGRTILEHFTKDLQQFDAVFQETDFKFIPAKADRHFKDLKILPVQELVFYGLQEAQAPLGATGVHLDAKDFHEMLNDTSKETVVVDVRNHYEGESVVWNFVLSWM